MTGREPEPAPFHPEELLRTLLEHYVDFVVVGGVAGGLHGSARTTYDLDIAYARKAENVGRLASALRYLDAQLSGSGVPDDLPFLLDAETLARGGHFTFRTRAGRLDILDQPDGAPPYPRLRRGADELDVAGLVVRVASLDHLIAMKSATGRPRDRLDLDEYVELARLRADSA